MKNTALMILLVLVATISLGDSQVFGNGTVDGVFGMKDSSESTAVAFWIPLDSDESISGVMWFNNDGDVVFPEVLAVAGDSGQPELLAEAVVVADQVTGGTLATSEIIFDQPLASGSEGLYIIWKLPADGAFNSSGLGGGPGFGFLAGEQDNRCWVSEDGVAWEPFTVNHQMAMIAIGNSDKIGNVLVLAKPGEPTEPPEQETGALPENRGLELQATPNPFNPSTDIHFTMPSGGVALVELFDVKGNRVRRLWNEPVSAGLQALTWDGRNDGGRVVASGVYFVRIVAHGVTATRGVTLLK